MSIKGKINRLTTAKINQDGEQERLLISVKFSNHFKFSRTDTPESTVNQIYAEN